METVEFWVKQLLEIKSEEKTFYTQIVNVTDEFLHVQHPVSNNGLRMNLDYGKQISVFLNLDGKGVHQFLSAVALFESQLAIPKPSLEEIKRAEKRNYFRVPTMLEIIIETQEGKKCCYTTKDISGGGLAFLSNDSSQFAIGDKIKGTFAVTNRLEIKDIEFHGKIVHVLNHANKPARISVEFIEMNESTRREIISYCIRRQIEIRNKVKKYRR